MKHNLERMIFFFLDFYGFFFLLGFCLSRFVLRGWGCGFFTSRRGRRHGLLRGRLLRRGSLLGCPSQTESGLGRTLICRRWGDQRSQTTQEYHQPIKAKRWEEGGKKRTTEKGIVLLGKLCLKGGYFKVISRPPKQDFFLLLSFFWRHFLLVQEGR